MHITVAPPHNYNHRPVTPKEGLATNHCLNQTEGSSHEVDEAKTLAPCTDLCDVHLNAIRFANRVMQIKLDKQQLRENFAHDFLAMLNVFSQAVASLVLQSPSRDYAEGLARNEWHCKAIRQVRKIEWRDPQRIYSIIKLATGNCSEMATLCKHVVDEYLLDSMKKLGYKGMKITSFVISAKKPSDHRVLAVASVFMGEPGRFMVDPFADGMAWCYEGGVDYHNAHPDHYIRPPIKFVRAYVSEQPTREQVRAVFDHFKIDILLDTMIKKNQAQFRGVTT